MRAYTERVLKLNKAAFRRTLGVKLEVYMQMRNVLEQRNEKWTLSLDDQLVLTLGWCGEYRTHHHLSSDWEVDESTIRRTIERVENALIHSGHFRLPGRRGFRFGGRGGGGGLDGKSSRAAERKQRRYYSGKKKRHTHKSCSG